MDRVYFTLSGNLTRSILTLSVVVKNYKDLNDEVTDFAGQGVSFLRTTKKC